MRNFVNLADVPREEVETLSARAAALRRAAPSDVARGRLLGLLFLNPSLRTRVSMVGAWARLGGACVDLTPGQGMWQLAMDDKPMLGDAVEHIEEAAGVLGRLCDVLGVRAFASGATWAEDRKDGLLGAFMRSAACPLINMESGMFHPCQALADWRTLDDHKIARNARFVLSWAYHPKALPQAVPNSALLMAAQRGMETIVLRPDGYSLDNEVMARANVLAAESGGSVSESADPAVLDGAAVVYAKSWGSLAHYGKAEDEKVQRAKHRDWCVGASRLPVGAATRLMHCLPVRRDVVVTRDLLTSKQSLILDQAENRKWAQCAVLERIVAARG